MLCVTHLPQVAAFADAHLVVAKDEREKGPRAILNYGHTAGHALEAASGFRVSHGRAVAFGMRVAAEIALSMDLCGKRRVESQDAMLTAYGLPDRPPKVELARVLATLVAALDLPELPSRRLPAGVPDVTRRRRAANG